MTEDVKNSYIESALFGIQRLKSRIVTQISHEFRTPLTSIIGFAELLGEDTEIDNEQRLEFARYIRTEGLRLAKLVDDLIQLDSLEHGHAHLQLKESEIQATVHTAAALIEESALSKSINIAKELPDEPFLAKYDHEKITQALYQLLHNAVQFTKPGGLVLLKVKTTNKHVEISVQDNGPGIPVKNIPTLFKRFEKFYRPGEETHGTGVGLALVKHIVDQHNGTITVHSHLGEGSIFTIRIPILS
jgi:signal transduction histidine kinase